MEQLNLKLAGSSLCATAALAAQIEAAECRLSVEIARGVAGFGGAESFVVQVGEGAAVFARPDSPMNKLIGIGFGPIDVASLEVAERAFSEHNALLQAEISTLAGADTWELLGTRGYRLVGFENVLGLHLRGAAGPVGADPYGLVGAHAEGSAKADADGSAKADADGSARADADGSARADVDGSASAVAATGYSARAASAIAVSEIDATRTESWIELLFGGFSQPDDTPAGHESHSLAALRQVLLDAARARGYRRYLASLDGQPAGVASMRLDGRISQLTGAATLPAQRRRGVQAALLATRLRHAREAGCELALVTTAPGSHSQANAMRSGFELLYSRAVLVREPR